MGMRLINEISDSKSYGIAYLNEMLLYAMV